MQKEHTIFTDFLYVLGVPHTKEYSDKRFSRMDFNSLFGLTHLLREYGVDSLVVRLADNARALDMPVPMLCQTRLGVFVIVTSIGRDSVCYLSEGVPQTISREDFVKGINGIVLVASPGEDAAEPGYRKNLLTEMAAICRDLVLTGALTFLFVYAFVINGLWRHWGATADAVLCVAGIYISFLLLQKTLKVKSAAADAVCGVIQAGGCDHVLSSGASRLLGLIAWSEIGMGYFTVSLCVLLMFPDMWGWLAVCNCFCLPYAFWSIWYQKIRARHWCTLCLTVQALLWSVFAVNLLSGMFGRVHMPLNGFFILTAAYIGAVCLLNRVDAFILSRSPDSRP